METLSWHSIPGKRRSVSVNYAYKLENGIVCVGDDVNIEMWNNNINENTLMTWKRRKYRRREMEERDGGEGQTAAGYGSKYKIKQNKGKVKQMAIG